jgi:hypothetical protein
MQETLRHCEQDVEQARSKLSHDLATLRAPETFSSFTDDVKLDALEMKDAVVDQAKHAAQSKLTEFVEDVKARAAANPAAALAIGAGVAWRLLRNPPIATALIGAGLYSLWRTNGSSPQYASNADYLQQGKQRLKEQAGDLAASAKEIATDMGEKVSAQAADMLGAAKTQAAEMLDVAKTKAGQWSDDLGRNTAAVGSALKAEVRSLNATATDTVQSVSTTAKDAAIDASARTSKFVREAMHDGRDAFSQVESRDKLLLGVAGVAVAAALGIACQKRMAEEVD